MGADVKILAQDGYNWVREMPEETTTQLDILQAENRQLKTLIDNIEKLISEVK